MASALQKLMTRMRMEGASDELHDHPCVTCSDEGNHTEAVYQCIDCKSFYCKGCVIGHNKFTKNHNVIDRNSKIFGKVQKPTKSSSAELPIDVCKEHHEEVIKMYCRHHDVVSCTVCIAVKHRSCQGIEYIPNISKGILKGPERKSLKKSLRMVNDKLQNLKTELQTELDNLDKKRDDMIDEIQNFKKRMFAKVEELEERSLEELKRKHKEIADDILEHRSKINDMMQNVEMRLNKIKHPKSNNEAQIFVDIKYGEEGSSMGNQCVQQCIERNLKSMSMKMVNKLATSLEHAQSLVILNVVKEERTEGIEGLFPKSAVEVYSREYKYGLNQKSKGASYSREYGYGERFNNWSGLNQKSKGASYSREYDYGEQINSWSDLGQKAKISRSSKIRGLVGDLFKKKKDEPGAGSLDVGDL